MVTLRVVEAYCVECQDIREHEVLSADPGSCKCDACGTVQNLVHPLEST